MPIFIACQYSDNIRMTSNLVKTKKYAKSRRRVWCPNDVVLTFSARYQSIHVLSNGIHSFYTLFFYSWFSCASLLQSQTRLSYSKLGNWCTISSSVLYLRLLDNGLSAKAIRICNNIRINNLSRFACVHENFAFVTTAIGRILRYDL